MAMESVRHAAALAAACGLAATAQAQNTWTNPAGGLYGDASNWSGGTPTSTDDLLFDLNAAYTVTLDAFGVAGSLAVGDSDLTIDLNANSLILFGADPLRLPSPARGTDAKIGRLTFQNGDVLFGTAAPVTLFGQAADGPFLQGPDLTSLNALLDFSGDLLLEGSWIDLTGADAGLNAGAVTLLGTGQLSMSGGATAQVSSLVSDIFTTPQGSHRIAMDGAGTRLDIAGELVWSSDSNAAGFAGQIFVTNGAQVTAGSLRITEYANVGFGGVLGFELSGAGTRMDIAGLAEFNTFQATNGVRPIIEDGAVLTADEIRARGDGLVVRGASSRVEATTRIDMGGSLGLVDGATVVAPTIGISTLGSDSDAGLGGHGTVQGDVVVGNAANFGTWISPGSGGLTITGDFERASINGGLNPIVYLNLSLAQSSGFLTIGGTADLNGFDLLVVGADISSIGETITLIDAGTIVGEFDTASLPDVSGLRSDLSWSLVYTPNSVELTLVPAPGALTVASVLGLAALRRRR